MDKIDELLTRGIANIIPNKQELEKILRSGKKLNIYLGIDPTAPRIHLGHAVPLRTLQAFAELGHHATLLIGDFTTLVGDTSDKDSERPILTEEEIKQNFQTYKNQAEKLIDFSQVKIQHNSEWLAQLTYKDILRFKQQFSLNDFISRELIKKRLDEGKRVRLDEVEYPIMQGYDSYFMDTDIQLGATDQTFNMQAGRTLQKVMRSKESYVLANTYLDGTDGRKMSKSWGNAIWIDDAPEDMFAKIMAINDGLIVQYYTLASNVPIAEIEEAKAALKKGEHPMTIKKDLAFEIIKELYDIQKAEEAKKAFEKKVQRKETPKEINDLQVKNTTSILEALIKGQLAESKGEAKRLIEQGGVTLNNKKITDANSKTTDGILKVGKRRFVKIVVK